MDRIDKIIASHTDYSRKDVKKLVSQGRISIDGKIVYKSDIKIDVEKEIISVDGVDIDVKKCIYLILHKPKGYISATEDKNIPTVIDLVPKEFLHRELFPAGRLDKDTTGLMIITDDGKFAHNILSPKKHVKKLYDVTLDIPTTEEMVIGFREGIKLNDGECKSAIMKITGTYTALVTLTEGRYHQIKRMFGCYGAKVTELHRLGIGNLLLPNDLKEGECRELTKEELLKLQELL